jgi:type I restriction enzyme S subunit
MSLVVPFEEIFADTTRLLAKHESWERVELGEICTVLNGFPFKSVLFNREKGFPIVRIRDLSKGTTETLFDGEVPPEVLIGNGDLLIGMDGIFRCYEWRGGKAGLNQRACKLIPNELYINRKFLLFGINGYLRAIEEATSSVTVGHLSSRDILRIPFPLPPLAEQRRIVAKLVTLLGKVDACQKRLGKIPILLKRFRQSVLAAACSGRLTVDWRELHPQEDWPSVTVEEVAPDISYGYTARASEDTSGVKFLRITDIQDGRVDWGTVPFCHVRASRFSHYSLRARDIVFARTGATTGKSFLIKACPEAVFASYLIRVRAGERVAPEFLYVFFQSDHYWRQISENIAGSAQPNCNATKLASLSLTLPSAEEQQEIVRRVEALFTIADQIETRYAKAQAHVDHLTPSLLARTFRGNLVPTEAELARAEGRDYEPASVLLERIRASRSETRQPSRRKPSRATRAAPKGGTDQSRRRAPHDEHRRTSRTRSKSGN